MIQVVNFKFKIPENSIIVNTTSRSNNWSRGLSPFVVGPVECYGGFVAKNAENLWQHTKCFYELDHIDENGNPTPQYFKWAQEGWDKSWGIRYPVNREAKPAYSYWDGKKLDYIEARKQIYIPKYAEAVRKTEAFAHLEQLYQESLNDDRLLILQAFDSHNLPPPTDYWKLWNNSEIKVGHGYVLAMMLEGTI